MIGILVTGAGGAAGVAVVRALADRGVHVVAADIDPLAAGMQLADDAVLVAPASDPDAFVADVAGAIERFRIDAVICTIGEEMLVLADHRDEIRGAAIWLPTRESIETCIDKWKFARVTELAGVPVAATALAGAEGVPGPWIVKPRFGRGSRDVYAVDELDELAWACRRVPEPVVQTRLTGREFTVDLLTDHHGRLLGAVPRWRLETRGGISTKGRTFEDERVIEVSRLTLAAVGLQGAANLQGFVTDDGNVDVIELNPRFSGGLSLSLAAGADLVGEFVRGTFGSLIRPNRLKFRPGVTMTRYLTETYAA